MSTSNPTTILGIWAHPDDEAYLAAGLALRTVAAGGRMVCRHFTLGELGTEEPAVWPPERLAPRRREELAASLQIVGVDDHDVFGLPDGGCATTHPEEPVRWIADAITRLAPDVVVTFGPDGMTGHTDHIAVSRWTTRAWLECGIGTLLYAAAPASDGAAFADMYEELGMPVDPSLYVSDDEIVSQVVLDEDEIVLKRRCLAAHATQTEPLVAAMGEARYIDWIRTESFRLPRDSDLHASRLVAAVTS